MTIVSIKIYLHVKDILQKMLSETGQLLTSVDDSQFVYHVKSGSAGADDGS